jgi:catechol 2,3-dioxygenase-like lactoylglutathione lyase family enzyme
MLYHQGRLLDHVHLRVSDLEASMAFYAAALEALGLGITMEGSGYFAADELFVSADGEPTRGVHIAFQAADQETVQRFHAAALAAGGTTAPPASGITTATTTPPTRSTRTGTTSRPSTTGRAPARLRPSRSGPPQMLDPYLTHSRMTPPTRRRIVALAPARTNQYGLRTTAAPGLVAAAPAEHPRHGPGI